jgi:hypothetical protein
MRRLRLPRFGFHPARLALQIAALGFVTVTAVSAKDIVSPQNRQSSVPALKHSELSVVTGAASALLFVPGQRFAFTAVVDSDSGSKGLITDLSYRSWVLERFAGLHNPPVVPQVLSAAQLAPYQGRYTAQTIGPRPVASRTTSWVFRAAEGRLRGRTVSEENAPELDPDAADAGPATELAIYRDNCSVFLDDKGTPTTTRADFVPGPNGDIAWFRLGGRLYRHMD